MQDSPDLEKTMISQASGSPAKGLMGRALSILRESGNQNMKRTESKKQNAIVMKDGVFKIRQNLETSCIKQDVSLKELVDSVIHCARED